MPASQKPIKRPRKLLVGPGRAVRQCWETPKPRFSPPSFRQPRQTQTLCQPSDIFLPPKRKAISEIGDGEGRVSHVQAFNSFLCLLKTPGECVACGRG